MGLIAREVERRGIATISLSSARSITAAVNPPRALYLDFPLGRTAGKAEDTAMQAAIMERAIEMLANTETAGQIIDLPYRWADTDDWKDRVMRPSADSAAQDRNAAKQPAAGHRDARVERFDTPQYQHPEDDPGDVECETCVFPEPS